jgi:hypothetical protein
MEFQAYPTSVSGRKSSNALLKTQGLLHGNDSVLLPCSILLIAGGFVLYEHMSSLKRAGYVDNAVRNFLALILVTMVPLALLEKKILACAEPVKMISKISGKVLFLHAAFLAVRAPVHYAAGGFDSHFVYSFAGLVSACGLLPTYFGFRLKQQTLFENKEAFLVAGLAILMAIVTEAVNAYLAGSFWRSNTYLAMAETSGLYLELTAFVPCVDGLPAKQGRRQH